MKKTNTKFGKQPGTFQNVTPHHSAGTHGSTRYFRYMLVMMVFFLVSCAAPEQAASEPMNPFQFISGSVYFFLLGFACYWMLVLRPKEVEDKNHQEFIEKLQKGTQVITTSGILGKVVAITPEQISLEIATNTKIKIKPEYILPLNDKQSKK